MNIAVNIVNIEKARQPLPSSPTKRGGRNHPQPLPRREGSAMRWNCCRECCLVLSGMLLGTVGNAAFCMSHPLGQFVPMGGTTIGNASFPLSQWLGTSHRVRTAIVPFTIPSLSVNIEFYVHCYVHAYFHSLLADIQSVIKKVNIVYIKTKTFFFFLHVLASFFRPIARSARPLAIGGTQEREGSGVGSELGSAACKARTYPHKFS